MSCSRDAEAKDMIHIGKWSQKCHGAVRDQRTDGRGPTKESIKIRDDGREESDEASVIDKRHHEHREAECKQEAEAEVGAAQQRREV